MAGGSVDLAPLIWWTFGLALLFIGAAALVVRVVWSVRRRGRRLRCPLWLLTFSGWDPVKVGSQGVSIRAG